MLPLGQVYFPEFHRDDEIREKRKKDLLYIPCC